MGLEAKVGSARLVGSCIVLHRCSIGPRKSNKGFIDKKREMFIKQKMSQKNERAYESNISFF